MKVDEGRSFLYLRNHIRYKLHGRVHRLLEEVDHDSIKAFSKGWIPSESLLQKKKLKNSLYYIARVPSHLQLWQEAGQECESAHRKPVDNI